jgi:Na+/H+-translocating membrane pyrophosphatase
VTRARTVLALATSIFVSFTLASLYGVALAALGILSTLAVGLTIDAYGPISDNAGGIAEMAGIGEVCDYVFVSCVHDKRQNTGSARAH